mgnify:CR=1 FL=1
MQGRENAFIDSGARTPEKKPRIGEGLCTSLSRARSTRHWDPTRACLPAIAVRCSFVMDFGCPRLHLSRRPDILYRTKREVEAMEDLNRAGVDTNFVPYENK